MLLELSIENIAVISKSSIRFREGFNVLTGETGAGKSILLGAIGAVLGYRTSKELIRTGENKASVSAIFVQIPAEVRIRLHELGIDINEEDDLLLSREITTEYNICRINGTAVTVSILRIIGAMLINIHGQQDHQMLSNVETHRVFIDSFGGFASLLESYQTVYENLTKIRKELSTAKTDEKEKARKIDILQFQIKELSSANLKQGEDIALAERREVIRNSAMLTSFLDKCYANIAGNDELPGVLALLDDAADALIKTEAYLKELCNSSSRLLDLRYEIEEIAHSVLNNAENLEYDPRELDDIEERLDLINRLKKKYGTSIDDMLSYLKNAQSQLDDIVTSELRIERLTKECSQLESLASANADALTNARKDAAKRFTIAVENVLRDLDMQHTRMEIPFQKKELGPYGWDDMEFFLAVNPGEESKPMAKCASGGEMSRIMLAIKSVISGKHDINTLIFDEIDNGISGRAAEKVGRKLKQAAEERQIICVTHLAQVASYSDHHLMIEKSVEGGRTFTAVTPLDTNQRVLELARIISGERITEQAISNAKIMLEASTSAGAN